MLLLCIHHKASLAGRLTFEHLNRLAPESVAFKAQLSPRNPTVYGAQICLLYDSM